MKLGALKSSIRALANAPTVRIAYTDPATGEGFVLENLPVTKQGLLAELDRVFPGGKAVETHLFLNAEGGLHREDGGRPPPEPEAQEAVEEADELAELFG